MSHVLDALAHGNRLRGLPPGQKLAFSGILLALALVAPAPIQLLLTLWVGVWIVGHAAIPARLYLPILLLPLGFAVASLPALLLGLVGSENFASVQADVWQGLGHPLGGWTLYVSKLGINQASLLLTRSLAATSAMLFLLLTTPIHELIGVLRKLRWPPLLLELMVYVYGFIFTLMAIVEDIHVAQQARSGYISWKRSLHSFALLIGQLLERSLNSYRSLSMGLAARGFRSELRVISGQSFRRSRSLEAEAVAGILLLSGLSLALQP
ncbi:cobalt ECF transporter T component CbiQ [Synechococcus sp. CS-602]|uniref:cobalt ECF transporter T component CbiQ n=1 Tax=Synechococcaceae TaxID=1890426 RepID=UPI0008FF2A56|nr:MULTISPECIES: cobalt ECF transporter T component CbiQ [Synechococcaceae]MCT4363848.1 cobalt ECF transporter T component CbiQ [Candidatus Regnicoccus frigidus MAG-AL1]APD49044.1 cobalt ECF transporter T component CbiQ [Synechococcus sp. SynAce01]MCT0201649.1 cobalt ECF transporter T component CbiQ [Synechococcus sp. CS-603]MCT0203516.1 cobalt ECF transporter T component CbiQ [Synechococcus sp. CS-602]MCT0246260.1 cobalt ECF transporter T component CbiQ [Synechococcus sp. CS-601]